MGYSEYFIYSNNQRAPVEQLAIALSKYSDVIDLLCATEVKEDIFLDKVKLFGVSTSINPVRIDKGTKGLVFGTEVHDISGYFTPLERIRFKPEIRCLDDIVLSCNERNLNKTYEDYFMDSPVAVHGKEHYAPLKRNYENDRDVR